MADEDLQAFCEREFPQLVGTLTLHTGQPLVAEELAQEALARACARWGEVSQLGSPGAWVHRVALNLSASHFRRLAARRRVNKRLGEQDRAERDPSAAEALTVRRAVSRLPERQRTAIVLRYFRQFSVAETARIMGITDGSVRVTTSRALKRLRDDLGRDLAAPGEELSDV